jgi:CheY-like chemotaxis protein
MMITDMEMPNIDGFTSIDRCRQTGIKIPILVISSYQKVGVTKQNELVQIITSTKVLQLTYF